MSLAAPFQRLTVDAILPSTIRNALGLEDAASVYAARRPRDVPQDVEVQLEAVAAIPRSRGGTHRRTEQQVLLRVRIRAVPDSDGTGAAQLERVEGLLAQLVALFDGARPWIAELPDVISTKAEVVSVDERPNDMVGAQGVVRLSVFFAGDGLVDLGAGETPFGGAQ